MRRRGGGGGAERERKREKTRREEEKERERNKRKRVEGRRGHRGRRNKFKRKYFSVGRLVKIPVYIFSRIKGSGDLIAIEFIPTGQAVPLGAIPATRRTLCCSTWRGGERGKKSEIVPLIGVYFSR